MSVILQYLRAALLSGQGAGSRALHRQGKREEYCESAPHSPNLIDLIDAAGAWLLGDEGTNRYPRWAGLPLGSRLRVDEAEVLSALLLLPVEADGALVNGLGTASRDELQANRILAVGAAGKATRGSLLLAALHQAGLSRCYSTRNGETAHKETREIFSINRRKHNGRS